VDSAQHIVGSNPQRVNVAADFSLRRQRLYKPDNLSDATQNLLKEKRELLR
jgi:hypothetical protein